MEEAQEHIVEAANEKPIKVFMDGAFDMMHYGHMNAFRLGRYVCR